MSGSDGDVNVEPLPFLVTGDLIELFDEREPFKGAESPFVATLLLFRLKRRILTGRRHDLDVSVRRQQVWDALNVALA